jgi:hypothetical protein
MSDLMRAQRALEQRKLQENPVGYLSGLLAKGDARYAVSLASELLDQMRCGETPKTHYTEVLEFWGQHQSK